MSGDKNPIAFFDFDGTITTGDTLLPFIRFCVGNTRFYTGLFVLSPLIILYLISVIRTDKLKDAFITHYLSGYSYTYLKEVGKLFAMKRSL